jgi:hypothetical protein
VSDRRNLPASVKARLLNLARERREEFGLVLTRFALERLLYRLSRSDDRNQFVLKGALLLMVHTMRTYRPTRDLDLLARRPILVAELQARVCSRLSFVSGDR